MAISMCAVIAINAITGVTAAAEAQRVRELEQKLLELEQENARLRATQAQDSHMISPEEKEVGTQALPPEIAQKVAAARAHFSKYFDPPGTHGHSIGDQRFWNALRPIFDEKHFPLSAKRKLQASRKLQAKRRLQGDFQHAANACPFGGYWNAAESMDPLGSAYRP